MSTDNDYDFNNTVSTYQSEDTLTTSWTKRKTELLVISLMVTFVGGAAIVVALGFSHVFDEDFPNRGVSNVKTTSDNVKTTEPIF